MHEKRACTHHLCMCIMHVEQRAFCWNLNLYDCLIGKWLGLFANDLNHCKISILRDNLLTKNIMWSKKRFVIKIFPRTSSALCRFLNQWRTLGVIFGAPVKLGENYSTLKKLVLLLSGRWILLLKKTCCKVYEV